MAAAVRLSALFALLGALAAGPAAAQLRFVHRTTADTVVQNWSRLLEPAVRGDPNLVLWAAPRDGATPALQEPFGVWWMGDTWTVFTQARSPMPQGACFDVEAFPPGPTAFVHRALAGNSRGPSTVVSLPAGPSTPAPRVTQLWEGDRGGVYNAHHVDVRAEGGWFVIVNRDGEPMPLGAAFTVVVSAPAAAGTTQE